jgi:hypothetical protein
MRRTQRGGWPYSQAPNVQFDVNWDSPQSKGLVAWWPMMASWGASGDVRDLMHRFPTTMTNTPTWTNGGEFGGVLSFDDAANEYTTISKAPVTGVPLSLTAWVYLDGDAALQTIVGIGQPGTNNQFYMQYWGNAGDQILARARSAAADSFAITAAGAPSGEWIHACAVYEAADSRFAYWNGSNRGAAVVNVVPAGLNTTRIASSATAPGAYLGGMIADVRIYSRALSDEDVRQMYDRCTRWELYKPRIPQFVVRAPVVAAGAIMNQIQNSNLGADLYNGALIL